MPLDELSGQQPHIVFALLLQEELSSFLRQKYPWTKNITFKKLNFLCGKTLVFRFQPPGRAGGLGVHVWLLRLRAGAGGDDGAGPAQGGGGGDGHAGAVEGGGATEVIWS